jgi:hypothetical protein
MASAILVRERILSERGGRSHAAPLFSARTDQRAPTERLTRAGVVDSDRRVHAARGVMTLVAGKRNCSAGETG